MGKTKKVTTYEKLKERVISAATSEHQLMEEYIPLETAAYWRVGERLVWYAEEILQNLSRELKKNHGKSWNASDLRKMFELYLRHPTVEKLSGRCVGRKSMTLDELLDTGK